MQGLFKSPKGRANCYHIGNVLQGDDGQDLNHMISHSPWEYRKVFAHLRKQAIDLFQSQKQRLYIPIDEVGFRKKGKHSACVGHQYIGSIGKDDNGQVAVTAALSVGDHYCPVEMELFMPMDWQDDMERREKAGIPASKKHESKTVMALRMIKGLYKKLSVPVECVLFDALYGNSTDLLYQLFKHKIPFVGDIKKNLTVFLGHPQWVDQPYRGRGRKPVHKKLNKKAVQVSNYARSLSKNEFTRLTVRQGTKGTIHALYHMRKVWVLHEDSQSLLPLHLLIRKNADGSMKYALGFFNDRISLKRLAKAQAQRQFIERIFEEGKNIVGMADYHIRSWDGFHKHVALCCLNLLFLVQQKIKLKAFIGRVTAYQLQDLVNASISTLASLEQIIQRLIIQIPKYQNQIENHLNWVT